MFPAVGRAAGQAVRSGAQAVRLRRSGGLNGPENDVDGCELRPDRRLIENRSYLIFVVYRIVAGLVLLGLLGTGLVDPLGGS